MLSGGARWAAERGWGELRDLDRIEEHGTMKGAQPNQVSDRAKERQRREMGTLGSGNHLKSRPLPRFMIRLSPRASALHKTRSW
jgi:RNA-splicing ligase RtcB